MVETNTQELASYRIQVEGMLDPRLMDWFEGVEVDVVEQSGEYTQTTLLCFGLDQPHLRGVLNGIWDLNLTIHSVQKIRDLKIIVRLEKRDLFDYRFQLLKYRSPLFTRYSGTIPLFLGKGIWPT